MKTQSKKSQAKEDNLLNICVLDKLLEKNLEVCQMAIQELTYNGTRAVAQLKSLGKPVTFD